MEKNLWVLNENKTELIYMQQLFNKNGSLRTFSMVKKQGLEKAIEKCTKDREAYNRPSFIILDYETIKKDDFEEIQMLHNNPEMAGVPVGITIERDAEGQDKIEDQCYEYGVAMVIPKPVSEKISFRVERMAWQYEKTRNYEKVLQFQNYNNKLMKTTFERYFSDDVVEEILNNPSGAAIGGKKENITVMMADLRGFTALSENVEADVITDIINHFLGVMTEVIFEYDGSVIEFIGDAILAVFGAPISISNPNEMAIKAAICMQNAVKDVNEYNRTMGYPRIEMGIGLHRGETFIGNIGSERLMRYNIIGSTVNMCSRIEGCSVGGQILVSDGIVNGISDKLDIIDISEIYVKGISNKVKIYDIAGIHDDRDYILEKLPDEEFIPLKYELLVSVYPIKEKAIDQAPRRGLVKALSNKWAIIEMPEANGIGVYTDIEIVVEDKKDRPNMKNSYGKVMKVENNKYMVRFTYNDVLNVRYGMQENINTNEQIFEVSKNLRLILAEKNDCYEVVCESNDNTIRAIEMLDFIFEQYGMVEGNKYRAEGKVTKVIFDVYISGIGFGTPAQYLKNRIDKYFSEVKSIDSVDSEISVQSFKTYRKKKVPWAFVKTVDIVEPGKVINVKSLENTSGIQITADENKYIMIGIRGEVYDIRKDKFESSYEATDEELDVFERMLDFIPTVEIGEDCQGVGIDELAKLCYPKQDSVIYAKPLNSRTKVFGKNNREDYFVGNASDYLAVRIDDRQDAYIIKKDIFEETYEEAE